MHFRVRLMRRRGVRLEWRDVMNGPHFDGDLRSHVHRTKSEPVIVLGIYDGSVPVQGPIQELYQPAFVGMATNAFRLRGFEAGGFVQEWYVTVEQMRHQTATISHNQL